MPSSIEIVEFGSLGAAQPAYKSWSEAGTKKIQARLCELRYLAMSVQGYATTVDGIVGPQTIAALRAAFGEYKGSADAWQSMSAATALYALTAMTTAGDTNPPSAPPPASDAWRTPTSATTETPPAASGESGPTASAETPSATPGLLARLSAAAAAASAKASAAVKAAAAAGATAGADAVARAAVAREAAALAALAAAKKRRSNTTLYYAIGGGVLALGLVAFVLRRPRS